MKKEMLLFAAIGLFSLVATAGKIPKSDLSKLNRLMAEKLASDIRVVFSEKKNARICGGEGDAYWGQVQVNKFSRGYDSGGNPKISDRWEDVDKVYTIYWIAVRKWHKHGDCYVILPRR